MRDFTMKSLALTVTLWLIVSVVECGRVLVAAPLGTKSHQNTFVPMMKELAGRGHHLTLITNYRVKDLEQISNVDQIEIEGLQIKSSLWTQLLNYTVLMDKSEMHYSFFAVAGIIGRTKLMTYWANNVTTLMYNNPQVIQLLENSTFDLVLGSYSIGYTLYPLAWHFNASLAIINMVRANVNGNAFSLKTFKQMKNFNYSEQYLPWILKCAW